MYIFVERILQVLSITWIMMVVKFGQLSVNVMVFLEWFSFHFWGCAGHGNRPVQSSLTFLSIMASKMWKVSILLDLLCLLL